MITVCVFGETRIDDGRRVITARELGGLKPRLLLEYLAVHLGQPVSKAHLVDVLWPAGAPRGAIATMETYVSLVRRILEPGTPARESAIRTVPGGYCLDPERASVDLHTFTGLVDRARSADPAACADELSRALDLVVGDLLASHSDLSWADLVREQFAHDLASAWTLAAGGSLARADYPVAIAMARRALERDPYAEEAARHLICALWRMGRRGEALRAYEQVRVTLVNDLGVEPSTPTRDLHMAMLLEDEAGDWSADRPGDEDSLVLELVRLVRMMVREHGVEQARSLVTSLALRAA
jgi:DNA-binding SARP family transcriptional activator